MPGGETFCHGSKTEVSLRAAVSVSVIQGTQSYRYESVKSKFDNCFGYGSYNLCRKNADARKVEAMLNEVETFFELDPTGVFVGELNGKPIGCICFLKYDETFCVFADFVVEEEYRGKGYGLEMYNTAVKSVLPSQNISAYTMDEMLNQYVEKSGFRAHWLMNTFDLQLPSALQVLNQLQPSLLYFAKTIDEVDLQALYDYDTKVFGYPRKAFLQKFLRLQGSHARVAVDTDGNIVGYTAARVAVDKDEGYRLGPLFAESSEIAKVLMKPLFEEMLEKGWSSSPSVYVDCLVGRNAEAKRLMELLKGRVVLKATSITTKGIPKGRFDSWFAGTSIFSG